ncbi:tail assembly chaperone [Arthrobacter phage Cole]|uniref:Tail assembly chaperone n=1 Tax=Arthrobacter phage Cole TaxID=2944951 RepID=A0A9E7E5T3_9CAUD|nr:tail assembly chaperone [Arthrobacter phage Cole]URC18055.1 tail assembly chaperone [Arthrobacter phage Cole]
MADKPNVQLNLTNIRKEVKKAEVLKMAVSGSKVITFPDIHAMESTKAEEIFAKLNQNSTNWTFIAKWLSAEDTKLLKAEKLSVIELETVIKRALGYYEGVYGNAGGRHRLRELIGRYRPQVRADLMEVYGVDLAEWYVAGRWVALLDFIDGLPNACRLNGAIVNDPEMAELIASQPKSDDEWAPPFAEFDLNAHLLREVLHAVKSLRQVSMAAAGGKPGEEKPFPAPRTEIDRAIAELDRQWVEEFAARLGFDATDI